MGSILQDCASKRRSLATQVTVLGRSLNEKGSRGSSPKMKEQRALTKHALGPTAIRTNPDEPDNQTEGQYGVIASATTTTPLQYTGQWESAAIA